MKLPLPFHAALFLLLPAVAMEAQVVKSTNYVLVAPNQAAVPSRQAQLEWSARVFETLMGVRPPKGRIVFSDTPAGSFISPTGDSATLVNTIPLTPQPPAADGTLWSLSWFLKDRVGPNGSAPGFTALTHEAAHLQLVMTVNYHASEALKAQYNGYGSFLPDWLDEAVAVYHEPDGLKEARRHHFNLAKRIPFRTFFTMSHPGTPSSPQVLNIEARTPEEMRRKLAEFKAGQQPALRATSEALSHDPVSVDEFYTQALAVIEYFTAQGGLPFFRFVVIEQNAAKGFDEILRDWRVKEKEIEALRPEIERKAAERKVPGRKLAAGDPAGAPPVWPNKIADVLVRPGEVVNPMPVNLDVLEADFARWVAQNYPKYRPNLPRFPGK